MQGDERQVVDAFCAHLRGEGWQVSTEVDYADVVATRDGQTLYAEAKRRTDSAGLDVDTLYGQLLRRTGQHDDPAVRYAVVVPDRALAAAQRVPDWVRDRLRICLYAVTEDDQVLGIPSGQQLP